MIYLDNAATTMHKPQEVIDAVVQAMRAGGLKRHRLVHRDSSMIPGTGFAGFLAGKMPDRSCLRIILQRALT